MTRSLWKGPYLHTSFLPQCLVLPDLPEAKLLYKPTKSAKSFLGLRTWSRSSVILPIRIGGVVQIHNGRHFRKVRLSKHHVGHKFGEFVLTRKRATHLKKVLKVQNRKRVIKAVKLTNHVFCLNFQKCQIP